MCSIFLLLSFLFSSTFESPLLSGESMTVVSACILIFLLGLDFWLLLVRRFGCCCHGVRSGIFIFLCPLTLSRIDPTLTHSYTQRHAHTNPGTCQHAEMPHCTSAGRPRNLLECLFYHRVCVPGVALPHCLLDWSKCFPSFFYNSFLEELVWIITMLSFTTKTTKKKTSTFAKRPRES